MLFGHSDTDFAAPYFHVFQMFSKVVQFQYFVNVVFVLASSGDTVKERAPGIRFAHHEWVNNFFISCFMQAVAKFRGTTNLRSSDSYIGRDDFFQINT